MYQDFDEQIKAGMLIVLTPQRLKKIAAKREVIPQLTHIYDQNTIAITNEAAEQYNRELEWTVWSHDGEVFEAELAKTEITTAREEL